MHKIQCCFLWLCVCNAFDTNTAKSNEKTETLFLVDMIKNQDYPQNVLDSLCWKKDSKIVLQRKMLLNDFRYIPYSSNMPIIQKLNFSFTIVTQTECDFFDNFFEQGIENSLTAFPNVWIIFTKNYTHFKNKNNYIPINSHILIVQNNHITRNRFEVHTIYKTHKNLQGYYETTLGKWFSHGANVKLRTLVLTRNRTNFLGMPLRVSYVITKKGTFKHLTDYREKHLDNLTKINFVIFTFLCDLLNATQIRIIRNDWGFQSKHPTKIFTKGMFGDLLYGRADISGTVSFTPPYRLKYFKYLFASFGEISINFVFRAPPLAYYSNLFSLPFDRNVWYTCGGFLVVCCLVMKLIIHWESKENTYVLECKENSENMPNFWDIVMMQIAIVCQMDFFYEPKSISGKMATFVMLISFTFIYTAFSARIVLLLQSNTNSITNLKSLYNAKFDFGVEEQPYNVYYFKGPSDRANEYWRKLIYENKIALKNTGKDNFLTAEKGIQLVRDAYFALHIEAKVASYLIERTFSNNQKCALKAVESIYKADTPYVSCPKNSTYIEFFLVNFRRLSESGLHNREYRNWGTKKLPPCIGRGNVFVSVGLIECYFAFLTFAIGVCLSIIVFFLELIAYKHLKYHNFVC